MISITNPKVAGFNPQWASFPGFTFLFDNPDDSFDELMELWYLSTDYSTPFYHQLELALHALDVDRLTRQFLFCPLPYASYHVTAWDGVNAANITAVSPKYQQEWQDFLKELPHSVGSNSLIHEKLESELLTKPWPIQLKFGQLELWGQSSLVAVLEPANEPSAQILADFRIAREKYSKQFEAKYNVRPGEIFVPHVTLGYFANKELADLATKEVSEWNGRFQPKMQNQTIAFETISLYGFVDMATFFK